VIKVLMDLLALKEIKVTPAHKEIKVIRVLLDL
jgi:hypothetical protein